MYLKHIGGSSSKAMATNAYKRMITPTLANQLNMTGSNGKGRIEGSYVFKAIKSKSALINVY